MSFDLIEFHFAIKCGLNLIDFILQVMNVFFQIK